MKKSVSHIQECSCVLPARNRQLFLSHTGISESFQRTKITIRNLPYTERRKFRDRSFAEIFYVYKQCKKKLINIGRKVVPKGTT